MDEAASPRPLELRVRRRKYAPRRPRQARFRRSLDAANVGYGIALDPDGHRVEFIGLLGHPGASPGPSGTPGKVSWTIAMDPLMAAQALALLALVLATYRYACLVRRRALARRQRREREDAGLRGLVRVLGADQDRRDLRQRGR